MDEYHALSPILSIKTPTIPPPAMSVRASGYEDTKRAKTLRQ